MSFKEFWQRYKGEIGKLLVTHAALAVFSIMCSSPLLVIETNEVIIIGATIFVFAFYYYLVRSQLWTLGAKNKISADGGRLKLCPLAGLYMGLLASVPSFLLNIANTVTFYFREYPVFPGVHQVTSYLEFLWDAHSLGIFFLTSDPQTHTPGNPLSYLASSILPALFAGIAYYCGTKEFALFGVPQKNR